MTAKCEFDGEAFPVVETYARSISARKSARIDQEHSLNREFMTANLRPQTI